jgi:hypothetical protein
MSAHDLNLIAMGAAGGAYFVLVVWAVIAFWDDLRPQRARVPVQPND